MANLTIELLNAVNVVRKQKVKMGIISLDIFKTFDCMGLMILKLQQNICFLSYPGHSANRLSTVSQTPQSRFVGMQGRKIPHFTSNISLAGKKT